ncbi:MAG: AAA family ATPase [Planctomycetes bacterium]|nr:AAA family ATPase [Planctomycetota bacterium]
MYLDFYNLNMAPFETTPDPRFFYASEQHKEALAAIEYTIRMRKGYVLITGDIGSGKTTVGRTMCERCTDSAHIIPILHGHGDPCEMLRQILRSMSVRFRSTDGHARLIERLHERLFAYLTDNRPVVFFVDEAQTLSDAALEELRLLSNLDTATQKLVQIILVGQPELRMRLRARHFDALRQRIVMAKQLLPMSPQDTRSYIEHRIRAASVNPDAVGVVFDESAMCEMHNFSGGTPRMINFAADNCLLMGSVRQVRKIDAAIVRRVVADMLPTFDETPIITIRDALHFSPAGKH